ncbi:MAG TPA: amino acid permease [Thermoanaerobaculia bacterium]|nr:amino acid permease [Thermoanaerobaculia bacterium]
MPPSSTSLERRISRLDATAIVVGSMIGSGIFIVSAETSRLLGSSRGLLLAWTAAGALTVIAALCCAELAAMLPRAGGQYVFFREAYGPLAGFLFGWTLLLVIQTGTIAAVAVAFARFLGVLVPAVSGAPLLSLGTLPVSSVQLVALAVVALLTATNTTGLKTGTRTQNVFTAAKLAALLGLMLAGLLLGTHAALPARTPPEPPGGAPLALAFAAGIVGPLFSQSAWNNVAFAGEEVRDPGRSLPFALVAGCLAVAVLYVATNVAYLRALPFASIQHAPEDRVGTAAAGALLGAVGPPLAAAAIMVSTFGCLNGLILSGARVSFAMARDGLFFRRLARVNAAHVPAAALALQGAWAALLVLSGTYSQLLRFVVSADIALYVLLVLAVVVLRRRHPEWPRPFRTPAYPWLPLLYAAAGLALIALLLAGNPRGTWPGYAVLASGVPAYFLWSRRS